MYNFPIRAARIGPDEGQPGPVDRYLDGRQVTDLAPPIGQIPQKDGDIVIGIRMRVSARTRAEQHHAFKAPAIEPIESPPEAGKDRVGTQCFGQGSQDRLCDNSL
jgi:hypothetical protein